MGNHILTKEQREAGLDTHEDDHNLYITDTATGKTVAVLGNHATIREIQIAANYYLHGDTVVGKDSYHAW